MKQLREDFMLILRGVGVLHRLSPWNLLAKCVRSVCNAALPFANLYLSAAILDALAAAAPPSEILMLIVITLTSNLFLVLLSKEMDAINYRKWNEFYMRYNFSIGEQAQSLPYEKVEDVKTHLMIKNIDDAMKIGNYGLIKLHSRIPLFVEHLLRVCFSVGFILSAIIQKTDHTQTLLQEYANSYFADTVLILLIVLAALACIFSNKRIAVRSYNHLGRLSKSNRIFDYYINHYLDSHKAGKDIRLYRQDRLILDEINTVGAHNSGIVDDLNREIFKSTFWILITNFSLVLYTYFYIGLKSMTGVFAVGSIIKYSGGVLQFANAFSDMMDAFSQLRANIRYLRDYFRFIDLPIEQQGNQKKHPAKCQECKIEVSHVSFRYPGTDEYVLRDVSFTIEPGEKIAIVGRNGSGKTTMIKLLCRLYDPTEGEIRCNGVDIREYNISEYRSLLGVVFQDFKLFSFTLGQNIAACVKFDRKKVESCLKKAGLEKRLRTMEKGIDTYLFKDFDENGIEVSGGEAQKIALARALYKETPLIILDEPTAALDPIAEAEIYEKFGEIVGAKTAVFISHRLSSCRFCDRILVFSDKMLAQQGSHEALLQETEGCYAKLWNAQAQYYE